MTEIVKDYPGSWFEFDMEDGVMQLVFVVSTLGPHIAGYGVELDDAYDDFADRMNEYEETQKHGVTDQIQRSGRWSITPPPMNFEPSRDSFTYQMGLYSHIDK
jgi:hypothetical protein